MENPLLTMTGLPPFSKIKAEHVEPAIKSLIDEGRNLIRTLLQNDTAKHWSTLIEPLEQMAVRIDRVWSPVSHLNAVVNQDTLRTAYNNSLKLLSEFQTEVAQNQALFQVINEFSQTANYKKLDRAQKKAVDNKLRDFRLGGVALPAAQKSEFKSLQQEMVALKSKFSENVLDASNAWSRLIDNRDELTGLPESALSLTAQNAQQKQQQGWLLNLDFPCYFAVMSYADKRELREEMYQAFTTRASDQGPHARQWDNSPIIESILTKRHQSAQLLGFSDFAEKSLATKMAESPDQVLQFLNDLAQRSLPQARQEYNELEQFAQENAGPDTLAAWDVLYYSEKLKQKKYSLSQEELRPYFPVNQVLSGLFEIIKRLYNYSINELDNIDRWHDDVRFFEVRNESAELIGQFYMDLYARENKRNGAWMAECLSRNQFEGHSQIPVAFINCNFSPPVADNQSLLTHQEVTTLFHECGHGLHHLLTRIDYPSVSGISGVAWDAVELPSQFMENWCWEKPGIELISAHHQTKEPLPEAMFDKLIKARNFQSALFTVRQLEFALFDFKLHSDPSLTDSKQVQNLLNQVRDEIAMVKPPHYNRFQHSFSHIFAGGYAAGYYSYKWAEVLSADAFSLFEENGIFDRKTGQKFLHHILEKGGSENAMDLFVAFRGRKPTIDALLRHSGLKHN